MQQLAGIISESQFNEAEENVTPEQAVSKAIEVAPKLEKSPELNQLAQKIANDPKLMAQLQQALAKGGVQANLNEAEELDSQDMKTVALNFAKKGLKQNLKEDDWEEYGASASYMGGFVGGGTLAALFTKAIAAAVPTLATVFAGPALAGALAGVALVALARKVYLATKSDNSGGLSADEFMAAIEKKRKN